MVISKRSKVPITITLIDRHRSSRKTLKLNAIVGEPLYDTLVREISEKGGYVEKENSNLGRWISRITIDGSSYGNLQIRNTAGDLPVISNAGDVLWAGLDNIRVSNEYTQWMITDDSRANLDLNLPNISNPRDKYNLQILNNIDTKIGGGSCPSTPVDVKENVLRDYALLFLKPNEDTSFDVPAVYKDPYGDIPQREDISLIEYNPGYTTGYDGIVFQHFNPSGNFDAVIFDNHADSYDRFWYEKMFGKKRQYIPKKYFSRPIIQGSRMPKNCSKPKKSKDRNEHVRHSNSGSVHSINLINPVNHTKHHKSVPKPRKNKTPAVDSIKPKVVSMLKSVTSFGTPSAMSKAQLIHFHKSQKYVNQLSLKQKDLFTSQNEPVNLKSSNISFVNLRLDSGRLANRILSKAKLILTPPEKFKRPKHKKRPLKQIGKKALSKQLVSLYYHPTGLKSILKFLRRLNPKHQSIQSKGMSKSRLKQQKQGSLPEIFHTKSYAFRILHQLLLLSHHPHLKSKRQKLYRLLAMGKQLRIKSLIDTLLSQMRESVHLGVQVPSRQNLKISKKKIFLLKSSGLQEVPPKQSHQKAERKRCVFPKKVKAQSKQKQRGYVKFFSGFHFLPLASFLHISRLLKVYLPDGKKVRLLEEKQLPDKRYVRE